MKLVANDQLEPGMRLAQNLFRHDSLLCLPKGIYLRGNEIEIIKGLGLSWILVFLENEPNIIKNDIYAVLNIIEETYVKNTLWDKEKGEEVYVQLEKMILTNKKVQKYLLELKEVDSYSFVQSVNVSIVVSSILLNNQEIDKDLCYIAFLTLLHDIGKIRIKNIINKQGKLDEKEYKELTNHPKYSFELLKKAGFKESDLYFVLEHHERYDGLGYPLLLSGEQISSLAQFVFIADVYNALSSPRPYRGMYTPYQVVKIIEEENGKSFSPQYIEIFRERFNPYHENCMVQLNDGNLARVREFRSAYKTLPVVDVISKNTGETMSMFDLSKEPGLQIVRNLSVG